MSSIRERVKTRIAYYKHRRGYNLAQLDDSSRPDLIRSASSEESLTLEDDNYETASNSLLFDDMELEGEDKLAELQAQLMSLAIHNEQLKAAAEEARRQLEEERASKDQEQPIQSDPVRESDVVRRRRLTPPEPIEEAESSLASSSNAASEPQTTFIGRAKTALVNGLWNLVDDLQPETHDGNGRETGKREITLSPKKLRSNFSRFTRCLKPIIACFMGLRDVFFWKSPSYTIIVFLIYYLALLKGYLLSAILFACIARLGINYLIYRKHWDIKFTFLTPYEDDSDDEDDKDNRVVNYVVLVAKKVQTVSGSIADTLEKFKNLMNWRAPNITILLFQALVLAFIISLFTQASTCCYYAGFFLGIKLFFLEPILMRYPRLKKKYDNVYKLWLQLPTDVDLGTHKTNREVEKYILPYDESGEEVSARPSVDSDDELFCQVFALPNRECPLAKWKGGRRCAIIVKEADKALPKTLKHGKIYLTRSFFCFERGKDRGKVKKRNLVIPLSMIDAVNKTKPFAWFPGGGMSLELKVNGVSKPIIFSALMGRDELYDSILATAKKANLAWATGSEEDVSVPADPSLVQVVSTVLQSDSDSED